MCLLFTGFMLGATHAQAEDGLQFEFSMGQGWEYQPAYHIGGRDRLYLESDGAGLTEDDWRVNQVLSLRVGWPASGAVIHTGLFVGGAAADTKRSEPSDRRWALELGYMRDVNDMWSWVARSAVGYHERTVLGQVLRAGPMWQVSGGMRCYFLETISVFVEVTPVVSQSYSDQNDWVNLGAFGSVGWTYGH